MADKTTADVNAKPKNGSMPLAGLPSGRYGESGLFNVLDNYDWTLAPAGIDTRREVPYLIMEEFEMDANALIANLKYWVRPIFNETASPYEGLYRATPTGVVFLLPWFEDYHHSIIQNWEDFKGLESSSFGNMVIKGIELLTNSPGIAINTPKVWKGAARATIPYTITLFNATADPATSIARNRSFINRLVASTLHDQQNPILASPPALYTVTIPGVRYSPACVISNLQISNIGTMIADNGFEVLPEAYKISFSITELISESRQIYDGAVGGQIVKAIISKDAEKREGEPDVNTAAENQANELDSKSQKAANP